MSATGTVPSAVPSVFHSSRPVTGLAATKNSVSPTTVRFAGDEAHGARGDVGDQRGALVRPVAFPHASTPVSGSRAVKNSVPPTFTRLAGSEPALAVLMSRTSRCANGAGRKQACQRSNPREEDRTSPFEHRCLLSPYSSAPCGMSRRMLKTITSGAGRYEPCLPAVRVNVCPYRSVAHVAVNERLAFPFLAEVFTRVFSFFVRCFPPGPFAVSSWAGQGFPAPGLTAGRRVCYTADNVDARRRHLGSGGKGAAGDFPHAGGVDREPSV